MRELVISDASKMKNAFNPWKIKIFQTGIMHLRINNNMHIRTHKL